MDKDEIHKSLLNQGITSTISHINSDGKAVWKVDDIFMFHEDAAALALSRSTKQQIQERNRGKNF